MMNFVAPKKATATVATTLSAEETTRRQKAVDYALGSARLEGFVSSDFAEQLYGRFIAGEITSKELTAKIRSHHNL